MTRFLEEKYLKAELNSIKINRPSILGMTKSLPVGINSDLLSLLESLCNIFLSDTLDTKVGELNSHVIIINIHSTHFFLTPISTNLELELLITN